MSKFQIYPLLLGGWIEPAYFSTYDFWPTKTQKYRQCTSPNRAAAEKIDKGQNWWGTKHSVFNMRQKLISIINTTQDVIYSKPQSIMPGTKKLELLLWKKIQYWPFSIDKSKWLGMDSLIHMLLKLRHCNYVEKYLNIGHFQLINLNDHRWTHILAPKVGELQLSKKKD